MIATPYKTLRAALGKDTEWEPPWATRLEVRKHGDTTVYSTHPDNLDVYDLEELHTLTQHGWNIRIDSQRLNRVRVSMTHEDQTGSQS